MKVVFLFHLILSATILLLFFFRIESTAFLFPIVFLLPFWMAVLGQGWWRFFPITLAGMWLFVLVIASSGMYLPEKRSEAAVSDSQVSATSYCNDNTVCYVEVRLESKALFSFVRVQDRINCFNEGAVEGLFVDQTTAKVSLSRVEKEPLEKLEITFNIRGGKLEAVANCESIPKELKIDGRAADSFRFAFWSLGRLMAGR